MQSSGERPDSNRRPPGPQLDGTGCAYLCSGVLRHGVLSVVSGGCGASAFKVPMWTGQAHLTGGRRNSIPVSERLGDSGSIALRIPRIIAPKTRWCTG